MFRSWVPVMRLAKPSAVTQEEILGLRMIGNRFAEMFAQQAQMIELAQPVLPIHQRGEIGYPLRRAQLDIGTGVDFVVESSPVGKFCQFMHQCDSSSQNRQFFDSEKLAIEGKQDFHHDQDDDIPLHPQRLAIVDQIQIGFGGARH